ncbi:MAG: protein-methionine-sulfoxide reductase catalytic subunit MsrP [Gammaproteobacteria bacterium]|nr:protein-methionine-sulfoxide reductase catalytic subunit MsrP [Gammaproteobacteria bacterium]|tara:strand:+ start:24158 stop:25084 length:927 start_codon:yes stop_codon:yes gene_type:complete
MSKYNIIKESEVTDEKLFHNRRKIIKSSIAFSFFTLSNLLFAKTEDLTFKKDLQYSTNEQTNTIKQITSYNNFYELGVGKRDPMLNANKLQTDNWKLSIEGEVENSFVIDVDDLLKKFELEERIYRLRCVEAWSMVIPWIGFELNKIIKLSKPTSKAKYVAFESILDRENLPGQKREILNWPYREGLRIDEAMNPLAIISVGLYGRVLPNQNGSPIRLVVPWKYGFKSIKSIVKIKLVEKQPVCTWNQQTPNEYGFYSNVNPYVSHPRWSQTRERRIGEFRKRDTKMFNGYSKFVSHMYDGMDLKKNF